MQMGALTKLQTVKPIVVKLQRDDGLCEIGFVRPDHLDELKRLHGERIERIC
jgi:hypothetical protein